MVTVPLDALWLISASVNRLLKLLANYVVLVKGVSRVLEGSGRRVVSGAEGLRTCVRLQCRACEDRLRAGGLIMCIEVWLMSVGLLRVSVGLS